MQGGIKRKSFPSFSRKGAISALNTCIESVPRAQQHLAFPLRLSRTNWWSKSNWWVEICGWELCWVQGVAVCFCFPQEHVVCLRSKAVSAGYITGQQSWPCLCMCIPCCEWHGSHALTDRVERGEAVGGSLRVHYPPFVEISLLSGEPPTPV